jgi:hypothetical protein
VDWEKTNPNEPKFKIGKMNVSSISTKGYENQALRSLPENKAKQTQSVVSLPALSKAEGSNLLVVSLSNLFQTRSCKNGPSRASTVEVISLECTIDDYGKILAK